MAAEDRTSLVQSDQCLPHANLLFNPSFSICAICSSNNFTFSIHGKTDKLIKRKEDVNWV